MTLSSLCADAFVVDKAFFLPFCHGMGRIGLLYLWIRCLSVDGRIEFLWLTPASLTGRITQFYFWWFLVWMGVSSQRICHFFIEMRYAFYWPLRLGSYWKLRWVAKSHVSFFFGAILQRELNRWAIHFLFRFADKRFRRQKVLNWTLVGVGRRCVGKSREVELEFVHRCHECFLSELLYLSVYKAY